MSSVRDPRGRSLVLLWIGLLVLIVVQWVAFLALGLVFGSAMAELSDPNQPPPAGFMIAIVVLILLFLWPTLCVYAKRWHDRNKSGWWTLIALVPIVGGIWMLIECGLLRGTRGDNRFGPDPLAE